MPTKRKWMFQKRKIMWPLGTNRNICYSGKALDLYSGAPRRECWDSTSAFSAVTFNSFCLRLIRCRLIQLSRQMSYKSTLKDK
jgi:hypothetical protein